MDFATSLHNVPKELWWAIPLFLSIAVSRLPWFKGYVGELSVRLAARSGLPKETYQAVHNVTLPTPDGSTQIDHIFVSRYGIFVVETKNLKGWIFGGANQARWTQKLYRKSFQFQNPLRQNFKHVKALEAATDAPEDVIHSVIVFTGGSEFKTPMPANVTSGRGYISYIRSFQQPVLSEDKVRELVAQIKTGRLKPSVRTHRKHVGRLASRSDPGAEQRCPRCGNPMVLRTAKRGARAGGRFWGCSAYPKCRVTQRFG